MSLRVVAGSLRGRRISTPEGSGTRPTPDRVREATFNALEARGLLVGSNVLDLFAGSGAMGIEALSRGAAHATFVDSSPVAIRVVEANIRSLGLADAATTVRSAATSFLRAGRGEFDIVFLDPPYGFDEWDDLLALVDAGTLVIESDRDVMAGEHPGGTGGAAFEVLRARRYGTTFVTIAQRRTSADHSALRKDRQ